MFGFRACWRRIVVLPATQLNLLPKICNAEKALQSRFLSRDSLGLLAVLDFVVVGSVTGMPPRRVFRHTWRDSSCSLDVEVLCLNILEKIVLQLFFFKGQGVVDSA
ncbi:hypothetical protein CC86DRAFT_169661 [Ophiobolus disseminans]|uniref:Uncharacterized protein n=1 Tax=Ophiobolus disseminans TaxID=1469910 RepID=A0A6A6ZC46_9PLEO|nr:hypothetical protein CC86DRAFT_169661 [Ophiobolus disseminans]